MNFIFKGQIQEDETLHFIDHAEGLIVPTSIKKYGDISSKDMEDTEKAKYQIYFFSDKYKEILSKEEILKNLNCYLKELKEERKKLEELKKKGELKEISQEEESKHTPTIHKINHLRKALVANMVGVITYLQKTYEGIVILEDLDKATLEKHFTEHNENIGRVLENSLYQKFQTLGKIPPHLKDLVQIRETVRNEHKNKIKEEIKPENYDLLSKTQQNKIDRKIKEKSGKFSTQFGTIIFTSDFETSNNCPYCENQWVWDKQNNNEGLTKEILKFKQHRYLCGKHKKMCDFDSYLFVKDEDRVKPQEAKNYVEVKEENKEKFSSQDDQDEKKLDFKEINDPDKVAAYNVAKKIQNKDIPPLHVEKPPNRDNDRNHQNQKNYQKQKSNSNYQNREQNFKNKGNQKGHFSNYNDSKNHDKKGSISDSGNTGNTFKPFANLKNQIKRKGNQK